jgi:chromosomal replication initiation ATPase DnaA
LEPDELSNSIAIFDDIDVLKDKKIREATYNVLNEILENRSNIIKLMLL